MNYINIFPMWKGQTVFCIAGGASLTKQQVKYSKGYRTIAINDAYKLAPHADILYACDAQWWRWHNGCPEFKGYKLQHDVAEKDDTSAMATPYPGIDIILSNGLTGFSSRTNRIRTGGNSGYQAIHIAMHLGAKQIILLGYDMHARGDKSHWFGEHPNGKQRDSRYDEWIPRFCHLQDAALDRGIEIINCTPDSDLNHFRKGKLDILFNKPIAKDTCPECNAPLVSFMSMFKKVCPDCKAEYEWPLDKGQQPLIKAQR